MYQIREVTGYIGGECYLLCIGDSAVLLDSGFDFCGEQTVRNIKKALSSCTLEGILLSHSHYDHASGSATIRQAYPGAIVAAHPHARDVFAKPGAREVMRFMNSSAALGAGSRVQSDNIDKLQVDVTVKDGDTLTFGEIRVTALEAPGHTKCSLAWHFPDIGLLYPGETPGVAPTYPQIMPGIIINYNMTLSTIDRLEGLQSEQILAPHSGLIKENYKGEFFDLARAGAREIKELVWMLHCGGHDTDSICMALKERYYSMEFAKIQPEAAFDMNMRAMIPRIVEELS